MYIRKEGEIMPPFYYGLGYIDWMCHREVYFIMPTNYLIRWGRFLWFWWIKNVQHRESWFDKEVRKIREEMSNTYRDSFSRQVKENDKYRHAYYDCMKEINKYAPQEVKERLFNLE